MIGRAQFSIPARECGPVLNGRLEPIECRNTLDREIPEAHYVALRAERGEWLIVADLGDRR